MYKFLTFNGVNEIEKIVAEKGKYLRIENETRFGIEIWNGIEIMDIVLPFSTKTMENEKVFLRTNKEITTKETKDYEYVSIQASMIPVLKGNMKKLELEV